MVLAVAAHVVLVTAFDPWPEPSPPWPGPRLDVTLRAAPPPPERPARVTSSPPPRPVAVEVEDRSHRARDVTRQAPREEARSAPARPPDQVPVAAPADAPAAPTADERARARAVVGRLGRYRLDERRDPILAPEAAPPSRALGATPVGPTLAELLDHDEIALPFADSELDLVFYSPGVRGDLERLGDAVTRRFGFRTPGGLEVQCVWMVVVFACGW